MVLLRCLFVDYLSRTLASSPDLDFPKRCLGGSLFLPRQTWRADDTPPVLRRNLSRPKFHVCDVRHWLGVTLLMGQRPIRDRWQAKNEVKPRRLNPGRMVCPYRQEGGPVPAAPAPGVEACIACGRPPWRGRAWQKILPSPDGDHGRGDVWPRDVGILGLAKRGE